MHTLTKHAVLEQSATFACGPPSIHAHTHITNMRTYTYTPHQPVNAPSLPQPKTALLFSDDDDVADGTGKDQEKEGLDAYEKLEEEEAEKEAEEEKRAAGTEAAAAKQRKEAAEAEERRRREERERTEREEEAKEKLQLEAWLERARRTLAGGDGRGSANGFVELSPIFLRQLISCSRDVRKQKTVNNCIDRENEYQNPTFFFFFVFFRGNLVSNQPAAKEKKIGHSSANPFVEGRDGGARVKKKLHAL